MGQSGKGGLANYKLKMQNSKLDKRRARLLEWAIPGSENVIRSLRYLEGRNAW
jgi:hypothetical protein